MALELQPAPKLQPALLAGLFIGVLSALPFVNVLNCCCLWVITGGMLAAYVMQQNHPLPITVGEGAVVGLLAGFFGAITQTAISLLLEQYLGGFTAAFSDGFMRSSRQDMPPEVRRFMNEIGPRGLLVIGSLMFGAVSLIFAMLGGILGAIFFKKPAPPTAPPSPSSLPPPMPPAAWTSPTFQERSWPPPLPPDETPPDEKPPGA